MTIYEFLKNDHKEVKLLLKKAKKNLPKNPKKALGLFKTIKSELICHAKAEEEVFYLPLIKMSPDAESLTMEGKSEHHLVALVIKEMDQLDCSSAQWAAKLNVLCELVEHHIKEEESDIFKKARSVFSLGEAKLMAIGMQTLKERYKPQVEEILTKEVEHLLEKNHSNLDPELWG